MRTAVQRHAILLAALLQVLPIVRNLITNPAATSGFAFILRWGIGTAATVGAYDACSGATNYFIGASNFTATVGVFFTNNVTILSSQGDGSAVCTITTNSVQDVIVNGQSTTFGMPGGLTLKFFDPNSGKQNSLYLSIAGTPTASSLGTNAFHIDLSRQGSVTVPGDFKIVVAGAGSLVPPQITNSPVNLTNLTGTSAIFSVTNGGTAPFQYQWYFNTNTPLPNATNASVTVTNIQLASAGYYRVAITNSAGTTNSANALLTVWQPPVITNQPVNVTNVAGGGASFTITAGGIPALYYQWKFNTNTTLYGSTNPACNLAGLRLAQTGNYTVVITNLAGSITSTPAALLVTNPPPPLSLPGVAGGQFQFTFSPIPGLTNTVLTNGSLSGGNWGVLTNLPPPANNNSVTIPNLSGQPNLFYRIMVQP